MEGKMAPAAVDSALAACYSVTRTCPRPIVSGKPSILPANRWKMVQRDLPETELPSASVTYNARLGIWLFLVYCVLYGGFMGLSAFSPQTLRDIVWAGLPLSLWYGLGLIGGALLLAVIYMVLCQPEVVAEKVEPTAGQGKGSR